MVTLSPRKIPERPWWYSPSVFQIIATDKAIKRCQLDSLLIQKILAEMANARYPTRPTRARRKWIEVVCVEGAMYRLSCFVDEKEKMIVVTNINPPKELRKTHRHK